VSGCSNRLDPSAAGTEHLQATSLKSKQAREQCIKHNPSYGALVLQKLHKAGLAITQPELRQTSVYGLSSGLTYKSPAPRGTAADEVPVSVSHMNHGRWHCVTSCKAVPADLVRTPRAWDAPVEVRNGPVWCKGYHVSVRHDWSTAERQPADEGRQCYWNVPYKLGTLWVFGLDRNRMGNFTKVLC